MSASDSSSDYDRRQKQRRKGININKRRKVINDDDDDYERYHRKKRKEITVKPKKTSIVAPPQRRKKYASSDSESDEIAVKKRVSIEKKRVNISTNDNKMRQRSKPKAIRKPAIKTPTKKKKKVRKVQSEKVQLKSEKKGGKKDAKSAKKKKQNNSRKKAKTPTPKKKIKVNKKSKKSKAVKLKTGTPKPVKKRGKKRRLRKAATMTEREINLDPNALFGRDEKYDIGNNIDLSEFALDSKKRAEIKASKNQTYGGFRVKINYRYRIDDNRIGLCRYFGVPLFAKASEQFIGLVIQYNGKGDNDGSVQNKYYFRCREAKGLFVRPFRLIEDLGINTKQLTKAEIAGSNEMKQLMKDIRDGKKPIHPNIIRQKERERKQNEAKMFRRNRKKVKARKKPLKVRSKTVTNLDNNAEWKPPKWMDEADEDHGYDFLGDRPFHTKGYLDKHKWKDSGVSVTAFNKKNHY